MTRSRIIAAYTFVTLAFILLFARYSYLQLVGYGQFLQKAINNYSSIVSTPPIRGAFIDKNGVVLANNTVSYAVGVLPKNLAKSDDLFYQLAKYTNITDLDKLKFRNQLKNSKNYDLVIIKDDLSNTEVAKLTAHNYEFPQVSIFARTKRYYPFEEIYSHSIGYVGRISSNDVLSIAKSGQTRDYLTNDYIGKSGLEDYYEPILRGKLGKKIIQTDATGNETGLISNTPAVDGDTIQLTIDNGLQKLAMSLLGGEKGAIVAIDPQSGGVLTFASQPSFDPNWFIDGISADEWVGLRDNPGKPLLNRALQSSFPPGSTFKPFMGITALYLGYRTPSTLTLAPGYFVIPGSTHRFRDNDYPRGLGAINMQTAIVLSSDVYFYKLALEMGIDSIDKGVSLFGFGKKTGIDLPHEVTGLLPTRLWKEKRFDKDKFQRNWLPADSVTIGVGQGFNHYTPLQMAYAVSILANDGVAVKPHFLDKVLDENGTVLKTYAIESHAIPIKKQDIEFVKKAMQLVVSNGTARGMSYGLKYTVAGKTGTAQVVATTKNGRKPKFAGKQFKDHSWFIAFAPVENPKIAIAILVENGGFGAAKAVPIARKLFDYYLLGGTPESEGNTKSKPTIESKISVDNNDNKESIDYESPS